MEIVVEWKIWRGNWSRCLLFVNETHCDLILICDILPFDVDIFAAIIIIATIINNVVVAAFPSLLIPVA